MSLTATELTDLLKNHPAESIGCNLRDVFFHPGSLNIRESIVVISDDEEKFVAAYGERSEDYWLERLTFNHSMAPWFAALKDVGVVPKNFGDLTAALQGVQAYKTTVGDFSITASSRYRDSHELVFVIAYRDKQVAVIANYNCPTNRYWHFQRKNTDLLGSSNSVWAVTDDKGRISVFDNDSDFKAAVLSLPSYSVQVVAINALNQTPQENS